MHAIKNQTKIEYSLQVILERKTSFLRDIIIHNEVVLKRCRPSLEED